VFVLTFPPPPPPPRMAISQKSVVKVMFIDKLNVCLCINDYNSVEFSTGTGLIGLLY
jgi:hypothetical protein